MSASYPTYKSTSIPWLPEIPEHWTQVPLSSLIKSKSIKNQSDKPLLSVYRDYGVILKDSRDDNHNKPGEDLSNYKYVEIGNLVLNKMKTWQGSLGVSEHEGIVSPAYIVCDVSSKVYGRYLHYLLRCHNYVCEYNRLSYGIRVDQWDMHFEDFKRLPIFLPPLPEQTAIANYLDAKTEQINRFIEKKEKLIKSLREKIDVIVQSIEGEQLNDSKFWPTIPKTWRVEKAKRIFIERNIKNKSSEALLASTQDRGVLPKDMCSENFVSPAGDLSGLKLVCENDFVISLRSFQGGIEYSPYRGIISPAYTIFNLKEQYESPWMTQYYKYLFKTPQFISLLNTAITGIRDGKNVNWVDFAELPIPIPTEDDVKMMMDDFIRFEELVKVFEVEKQKLNEFKNSLIAEVVTGKIKVA